jgi:hypothetical protein
VVLGLVAMKTDAVLKEVEERITSYSDLPWLSSYTDHGSHRPDESPIGEISFQEIGKWLIVILIYRWEGTTMDQTTDRLGGDPYYCIVRYDWIGFIETAPSEAKTIEYLDEWALHSLKYVCENTDVGAWGLHEGSYIEDLKEDGTLVIRDQKGKYQDVDPMTEGELRTIQL